MPKVKRASAQDVEFHVTPWQQKKSGAAANNIDGMRNTDLPILDADRAVSIATPAAPLPSPTQAANAPADIGSAQKEMHMAEILDKYSGGDAEGDSDADAHHAGMHGSACIAWLPDGRCTGYVVDERWGMTLGLMGQRVLARQECTRDDEWQLLHMVLIDLTTRAQVSFLAERTGGDAAKLHAPVGVHGSEASLAQDETLASCDAGLQFNFLCETLLADAAAQKHIAAINPALTGQTGVTVNLGTFTCSGAGVQTLLHSDTQLPYDSDLDAG